MEGRTPVSDFQTTACQGKKNIYEGSHLGLLFLFA